jgi:hypothetical protein
MSKMFLTKWEREIMDINFRNLVKRKILTWEDVTKRKKNMQKQLEEIKYKLLKKKDLTDKEKDAIFREEFSRMVERDST